MSLFDPGSALTALAAVRTWWVAFCQYDDMQALPASGGYFLPASGTEILSTGKGTIELSAVFIFEYDQHAHEFLDVFHEVHKDDPKLQTTWKFMKVMGLRPEQVVGSLLRHGLVPVQVRREWAPAMFRLYRDGHVKSAGRHGPALQFAVDHALEDAARIERERRV